MRALEAGELEARALSLPPGSLVLLNSRTYHAVRPKPVDAEQEHRKAQSAPQRRLRSVRNALRGVGS